MTTIPPTTSTQDNIAADPHGLGNSSEALADEPELRTRFGVSGQWLRHVRRFRLARYLDMRPSEKPGAGAATGRYLYAVRDIEAVREAERARVDAARERAEAAKTAAAAAAPPAPPASPAPPSPIPPPRPPPPFVPRPAAKTTAKVRGRAPLPEVVYTRRVGGARS
jgi:hypothetical protein